MISLAPGLRACELMCMPCEGGISVSYSPLAFRQASPSDLQSHSGGLSSQGMAWSWGAHGGAQTPPSLGRASVM